MVGLSRVGLYTQGLLVLEQIGDIQVPTVPAFLEVLKKLPPETVVFPTIVESGVVFSILERELSRKTLGDYSQRIIEMGVDKFKYKLEEGQTGSLFIDVREEAEFKLGHLAGPLNMPSSEVGFHWEQLKNASKVYVFCSGGDRSVQIVRTLNYLGLNNVILFLKLVSAVG